MTVSTPITPNRANHYKRLGRYAESKKRTVALSSYIRKEHPELKKIADNLSSCGNYLTYRHYYETDEFRLIRGNSCDKHLLCGVCAARRSSRQYYHYRQAYNAIIEKHPDIRIVFFTLTVKNGDNLAERYQHLYSSMAKLSQKKRDHKKGRGTKTAMAMMEGAVWSYEVTNRGKGWHPHIHGVGLIHQGQSAPEIERKLKREWEEITGDSFQIKVEFPKNDKNEKKAFFEVFKYSLKFSELSFKNQIEVYKTLSGRRMMASNGLFYGVKIEDDEKDCEIEREFYDLMYKYDRKTGRYYLYHVEHRASLICTKRPQGHFREADLLKIDNGYRGQKWRKEIKNYCEKNGLKFEELRNYSSTICLRKNPIESVNTAKEQKASGATIGYQLPLITAEVHVAVK